MLDLSVFGCCFEKESAVFKSFRSKFFKGGEYRQLGSKLDRYVELALKGLEKFENLYKE